MSSVLKRGCLRCQGSRTSFRRTRNVPSNASPLHAAGQKGPVFTASRRVAAAQRTDRNVRVHAASDMSMGMDPELRKSIDDLIATNTVVVFMKGSRQFPQCGFSNTVVQILNVMGVQYETVDILADPRLRSGMKVYSQWPTFPQVYINGEFFGGCDIMIESYQSGELKEMLEVAMNS